jgi:hypothetical protein
MFAMELANMARYPQPLALERREIYHIVSSRGVIFHLSPTTPREPGPVLCSVARTRLIHRMQDYFNPCGEFSGLEAYSQPENCYYAAV